MKPRTLVRAAIAAAMLSLVVLSACTSNTISAGYDPPASNGPAFGTSDAGGTGDVEASLPESVAMCPVTTCSLPRATCPSSKFPCDVDLLNDDQNCGGCGIVCRPPPPGSFEWGCVAGQCTLACRMGEQNCDGDLTNGCEVRTSDDRNNCGDCGVRCPDGYACKEGECAKGGCPDHAPEDCNGGCTSLDSDDNNCGACGNRCDPAGPGLPPAPSGMHYGCVERECGKLKCDGQRLDCNRDQKDGCEASVGTAEHCNGCYDSCPVGKFCVQMYSNQFVCLCRDNQTFCPLGCVTLDDDPQNCGGCGRTCPGLGRPHFEATCSAGICSGTCADNYADCDGVPENGCEVDTRVDNRNCGACGNTCLPNQPCSEGKCLVAPCGEPETETK